MSGVTEMTSAQVSYEPIEIQNHPRIDVLYEDKDVLVINKPSRMLSVPGRVEELISHKSRHDEWKHAIQVCYEKIEVSSPIKRILEELSKRDKLPRKRIQFVSYLKRVLKVTDEIDINEVWDKLTNTDCDLHKPSIEAIPLHMVSATHLAERYCGISLYNVHRLDMDTSGILCFAKSAYSSSELSRQFRDRVVSKKYVARVFGKIDPSITEVNVPIRSDYVNRPLQVIDFLEGKPSLTQVLILKYLNDSIGESTLVQLIPVTGRTHQLRLHMKYIGHPILGDTLYGNDEVMSAYPRLCLHAYHLNFYQPSNHDNIDILLPFEDIFSGK